MDSEEPIQLKFRCQYLNDYLAMVEDTESPRLFHIWTAISMMAATLGRRCYLPFGPMNIYPNHYVFLVGTPASRKSTAAGLGKKVLRDSTAVRFAPSDTGGQRQGLVTAMMGSEDNSQLFLNGVELAGKDDSFRALTLNEIESITDEVPDEYVADTADKHHIMAIIDEVSQFLGQNNHGMLDFLTQMWQGEDYEYQLKSSQITLKNPLLNLVGCTTPTSLAHSMPPAAGGQGFLSRVILVYGAKKYKLVPIPEAPDVDLVRRVKDHIQTAYSEMSGPFEMSQQAQDFYVKLYGAPLEITDSRFGYYAERRHVHLMKLGMCIAAGRGEMRIELGDFEEANKILRATEAGMPDALGEFGLNPLASVKQQLLEAIRKDGVVPLEDLQGQFHRDAKGTDIVECLQELQRANQVHLSSSREGRVLVHAMYKSGETEDSMIKMLME